MAGTLFVQAPQVLWRDAGSEILLAPRDRQDVDVLSPTAGAVWRLLGQPVSEEELVEALARAFSVPVDAIRADVSDLLADLHRRRLIDEVADADD